MEGRSQSCLFAYLFNQGAISTPARTARRRGPGPTAPPRGDAAGTSGPRAVTSVGLAEADVVLLLVRARVLKDFLCARRRLFEGALDVAVGVGHRAFTLMGSVSPGGADRLLGAAHCFFGLL